MTQHVLYSFRRCPYAMRARLAVFASGIEVELREVVLRDKPPSLLKVSPKATVPVLIANENAVIDESRDIMLWALKQNDPLDWLAPLKANATVVESLIDQNDGPFKKCLDRYKYPSRYPEETFTGTEKRDEGFEILSQWDQQLAKTGWLLGDACSIADMALRPFVRQFAHVDRDWFYEQPLPNLHKWLTDFLESELFKAVMPKFKKWEEGTTGVTFPPEGV